uniref:Uncharacterized protein n=1 Tax=Streptomyces sp. NBC_01393 TaxID=2903851 RepID=A0AAU3I630_9ACTN
MNPVNTSCADSVLDRPAGPVRIGILVMKEYRMTIELVLAGSPVLLAAVFVLRRRKDLSKPVGLVRDVRDLITLRMVLRDAKPGQRESLLAAHRKWRCEPAKKPRG